MTTPFKKIGEVLVSMGYITPQTLDRAVEISQKAGKMIGQVLVENHFVTWNDIADALAAQYNLPRIQEIPANIPFDTVNSIPKNLIDNYRLIPYRKDGNTIWIATDNVLNYTQVIREIRFLTSLNAKIAVISTDTFETAYQYLFGSQVDTTG